MNAATDFPTHTQPPFGPVEDAPAALYAALAKAQMEFAPIARSKTVSVRTKAGGTYTFSYAPLESILKATLPALNKHGFSLVQRIDGDLLVTVLYHASGGSLSNAVKILVSDGGPQAYGSALTYSRRYGVTLLLGVCADDDDDGNAAEGNHTQTIKNGNGTGAYVTEEQAANIKALIDETNADQTKFLAYLRAKTLGEIPAALYSQAISALERKRNAQ